MDRQRVGPIFQIIFDFKAVRRQLAGPANRYETRIELMSEGTADDEAAGFDAHHLRDLFITIPCCEIIDHTAKSRLVLEQGRNVVEENPGFRIVGNLSN